MAAGDPTPLQLLDRSIQRLAKRVEEVEKETEDIPVILTKFEALEKEVVKLTRATDRNSNALFTTAGSILVTGVFGVLVALILKGVIG